MKRINQSSWQLNESRGSVTARTGFHCPVNGLWKPVETAAEPLFVFEGSIMPSYGGNSTEWTLVASGSGAAASASALT